MLIFAISCKLGGSYKSLQYLYRVLSQTIGQIMPVCSAIIEVLKQYIKVNPTSPILQIVIFALNPFNTQHLNNSVKKVRKKKEQ